MGRIKRSRTMRPVNGAWVKKVFTGHKFCLILANALLLGLLGPLARGAETPDVQQIVAAVNAVDDGQYVSRSLHMLMVDRRGKERTRETVSYRKYYGEEIRTVLFYKAPSNVRGTGFLIWDYPDYDKEDDQWLYLPALRKVRRIPASDRGDYFLGTDFTYEDIKLDGKLSERDYEFSLLGSADLEGRPTWRLEALPRSDEIADELGYSRNEFWVDNQTFIVLKAVFWDSRGKMLKVLEVSDIREVDGILTRHRLEMRNYKTGHRSVFQFSDVDYETPVRDSVYTRQALARGK